MDRCSSAWIRMRSPRSRSRARSRRSRSRSWSSAPGATCSRFFRSPAVSSGTVIACRAHCPRCSPTLSAPASAADRSSSRYVGRSACQGVWSHRILRRTARVSNRSKNSEPQTLPLEGELWAIIERRWRAREVVMPDGSTSIAPLVFHRDGEPIGNWYKRWRTACKEAGYEGRRFHDLRRSAVRHLRRAGNPEVDCMAITGHKTAYTFRRYDIIAIDDKRRALGLLATYREALPPNPRVEPIRLAAGGTKHNSKHNDLLGQANRLAQPREKASSPGRTRTSDQSVNSPRR